MRIGLFGNHLARTLIVASDAVLAAGHTPIPRNDVVFSEEGPFEAFDAIVVPEQSFAAQRIVRAYTARTIPTFCLPYVHEGSELLGNVGFQRLAAFLGLALEPPDGTVVDPSTDGASGEGGEAGAGTPATDPDTSTDTEADPPGAPLPRVVDLAAVVATLGPDELLDMMQRDTRKKAAPIYQARLAELTAPEPKTPTAATT